MNVLVIGHHAEDSAGFVGDALVERGAVLSSHVFPDDGPLPPVERYGAAIVLGARWSVYDESAVGSWIGEEIGWLRRADVTGVPVLGICFGAQVLAASFGGSVELAPAPEIGWRAIEPVGLPRPDAPPVVGPGPWMQFHFDRCVLPAHAVLHARSDIGPQAFSLGRNLGVQFHPEVDAAGLERWYDHGDRVQVREAGFDPDAILARTIAEENAASRRAAELVRTFLERAEAHSRLGRAARGRSYASGRAP